MKRFFVVLLICAASVAGAAGVITPHWSNAVIDNLVVTGAIIDNLVVKSSPWVDVRYDATFSSALAASANKTLLITSTITIAADTTIPDNVAVVVVRGGSFSIAAGKTLTINGPFTAGLYSVFTYGDSASGVVFAKGNKTELLPQWWGAVGDGVASDRDAIDRAFDSASLTGMKVRLPRGDYYCGTTGLSVGGITVAGDGPATLLWDTAFTGTAVTVDGTFSTLKNFYIAKPLSDNVPSSSSLAIDVQKSDSVIQGVRVYGSGSGTYQGWYNGIKYAEWIHELNSSKVSAYHYGVYGNVNALSIYGGSISAQDNTTEGIGLFLSNGAGNSAHGANIEGASDYGVFLESDGSGPGQFSMYGGYIEGQSIANVYVKGTDASNRITGAGFFGVLMNGSLTADYNIMARYVNGLAVTGGNDLAQAIVASVRLIGNVDNAIVLGNSYRSTQAGWVATDYATDTTGILQSGTGSIMFPSLPTSAAAGSKLLWYNVADNVVKYAP